MTKEMRVFLVLALALLLVIVVLILIVVPRLPSDAHVPEEGVGRIGLGSDTVKAEVLDIVEEGTITLGDHIQPYQILSIEVLEGPWEGYGLEIDYGKRQLRPEGLTINPGDRVLIDIGQGPDGTLNAYFIDFVRTGSVFWLFAAFVLFSILIGGWKGVRGLMGMFISLAVILIYIIPNIMQGKDPVSISIVGASILLTITLYLVYGWTLKTHAAVLGLLIALMFTGLVISFFVNLTRLTGFGNEDALFVIQQSDIRINLRGLVLAGMLIGVLGALDDLVITQASVVFELFAVDPTLEIGSLYRRAIHVGKDHVASMINTLVLAYVGAALPTMILFSLSGEHFVNLLNLEFVTEEVVRTLVGSIGLIAAAPISTGVTCLIAINQHRLGSLRRYLGPEYLGEGFDQSH